MAVCSKCGKKTEVGNQVSHANNRTKRRFHPNIQNVKIIKESGQIGYETVCARCIKGGKVRKAPIRVIPAPSA